MEFKGSNSWVILSEIEKSIKEKIERVGTPLKDWDISINYGIKTGFNDAFIITGEKRNELIEQDAKSAEIIRPILRGRDIKRYRFEFADLYIISTFPSLKVDIDKYPAVKQHLLSFGYDRLKQTGEAGARKKTNNQWFETQDSISYWEDFLRPKIVWLELTDHANFCLDTNNYFINNTIFFISGSRLEYLLSFLNSAICKWYFTKLAATSGVGTTRWIKQYIEKIFVPDQIEAEDERLLSHLAKEIQRGKVNQAETAVLELDILHIFYRLFGFDEQEINLIELGNS